MKDTPIVMIIDNNALKPYAVTVRSIAETTRSEVNIKIVGVDLDEGSIKAINSIVEDKLSIEYIDASQYLPSIREYAGTHGHVSNAALLKFFLPEIFKDYNRLLYIDVDIIVCQDLERLLSEDICEYYAGVIENLVKPNNDPNDVIFKRGSFNSGVILMNCEKMRQDNISTQLLEAKKGLNSDVFMDQTAFNIVLKDKVRLLSLKYNYLSLFDFHSIEELNLYYGTNYRTDKELCDDVTILHLAGSCKPWKYEDGYYRRQWEEIYYRSMLYNCLGDNTLITNNNNVRRRGPFTYRIWQGITTTSIGPFTLRASYYDGVSYKKRYMLSINPIYKCFFRRII